jgi:hypothetical protein
MATSKQEFEDITNILDTLGKTYYWNDTAKSIDNFKVPDGSIAVITSMRALKAYDPSHWERIRCIIMNDKHDFVVVVKNRDLKLEPWIRFWNSNSKQEMIKAHDFNCNLCYTKLKHPRKPVPFQMCAFCGYTMCVKCLQKVQTSDSAHKCPQCRQWSLSGEEYGLPKEELDLTMPATFSSLSLKNKIIQLFTRLDGMVDVIPRIDRDFFIGGVMSFCRLSYTDRFHKEHDKPTTVAKRLVDLYTHLKEHKPTSVLRFYTIRKTYKIDKEAGVPVDEISAFRVKGDNLCQYAEDDWIDMFDQLLEDQTSTRRKVVYTQPMVYVLPVAYENLLQEFNMFACVKTISVILNNDVMANFDMSAKNEITTLSQSVLTAVLADTWGMCCNKDDAYVTCRLFRYDDGKVDLITYKYDTDKNSFVKVDSATNRRLFNANIDELKHAKFIKVFL